MALPDRAPATAPQTRQREARSRSTIVATQITATTPRTRSAPRLGVLQVAIFAVIAAALIGVGVWSQAGSIRDVTIDSPAYGVGYPLHGGLAGPSRVGQASTVDLARHYGLGYPLHGGLAGPSRIDTGE
jgi:hypothetical protein